jgi:hypothetical protein
VSLINDALKKAQKQRTGEAPTLASMPGIGGESAQRIAKRAKPAGFNTLMVRAGVGAGVAAVLAMAGWLLLRGKPETGNLKPELSSAATQPSNVGPSAATPAPASTQVSEQPPTFTLKTDPIVPKPEAVAQKTEDRGQKTAAQVSASAQQPTTNNQQPVPPPKPAPKLEPKAIQFIENLKVAGIRASASDAKVLMNDRVYRIGGTVEAEMGLKLVDITANSLTFEDEHGGRYTRTF